MEEASTPTVDAGCQAFPYGEDSPLAELATELRARGAELNMPNHAPGARQVAILRPRLDGRSIQVWESAFGAGFLVGLGESVGPTSSPEEAADRIIDRLRERGRRC